MAKAANGDTAFCVLTVRSLAVASITLIKSSAKIQPGKYVTLTAKVTPKNALNRDVSWSTSNASVAIVSSKGKVKGIAPGVATITAKVQNGKSIACTITVVEVPVSKVKISRSRATMYTYSSIQLKGVFTPSNVTNKSLKWTSSNPYIATVTQSGLVLSRAKTGSTTITIVSANGKSSSFVVTVKQLPRDRKSEFEPELVKKQQITLTGYIEEKILSMYAKGMSTGDIERHIKEIYGLDMSDSAISRITDKILPVVKEW